MPLMKFCNRTGCKEVVPLGVKYCKVHTIDKAAENRERHKEYDAHCRNQKAKAFYNSTAWKVMRTKVLARDNHIDIYLYVTKRQIVQADTVHHIIELLEDYSKRLDMDNLISVSEETHSMISKAYKDDAKRKDMQRTLKKCLEACKKCDMG